MDFEAKVPLKSALPARLALALLGTLLALALLAPGASAITLYHHPLEGSFGPNGVGTPAKFVKPHAVAVDPGTHDVYVFDTVKESTTREVKLYRFTQAGAPDPYTAGPGAGTNFITLTEAGGDNESGKVAVAPPGSPGGTAGDVYVAVGGVVEVYSPEGAHLGTIDGSGNPNPGGTFAAAVGVDPSGDIYIAYEGREGNPDGHVDKYVPSANPPKNSDFDSELHFEGRSACEVAVGENSVYVVLGCVTNHEVRARYPVTAFPGGGKSTAPVADSESGADFRPTAVDASNEDLYVRAGVLTFAQYDSAGNLISSTNTGQSLHDVDVDPTTGKVYVPIDAAGGERDVRIYGDGEPVQPPTATIDPVTTFDFRSAHFTGTVNPGGSGPLQETAYRFRCTPECPGLEGDRLLPGDGADHAVADDATELLPETHYEVELIARNLAMQEVGAAAESRSTTSFETAAKPPATAPEVTIDPVTSFGSESAQLTGTVDPNGNGELQATTYRFEYSADGTHWTSSGDQGPIEGGPQEVSVQVEGLEPNTAYEVRLQAENVGGKATSGPPNPTFTTDPAAPRVEMTGATQVLTSSAQLNARIDPRNSATHYYFEWGPADCASNPCTAIPVGKDGDAGAGSELLWFHAQVEGLNPGTTYSYRLVAVNAGGETVSGSSTFTTEAPAAPCTNAEQRTGYSAALPECRAYEVVSPVDKNGGNVASVPRFSRVASDGNAVTFKSATAFAGAVGDPYDGVEYISLRGAEGWQTHAISPFQQAPQDVTKGAFTGPGYSGAFSSDLDTAVYRAFAPIPGATGANVAGRPNLFLATGLRSGQPEFHLLSESETPLGLYPDIVPYISYADASADFHKIAFETKDNLIAAAKGTGFKLYEWEDGTLRLAGILPDSACTEPPCVAPESVAGAGALTVASVTGSSGSLTDVDNVVSRDGSKVFFTAPPKHDDILGLVGSIYARVNGTATVQIDASERTVPDPGGTGKSHFEGASSDGNVVYFTSRERLVDGAPPLGIYRYDFTRPIGERLSVIRYNGQPVTGRILGVSSNGEFAYFVDERGTVPYRVFVAHGSEASLVTDSFSENDGQTVGDTTGAEWNTFRVSPNGRFATFASSSNLVGYDPVAEPGKSNCSSRNEMPRCQEIYLYSYDSGELTCVSCNFGHAPTGEASYNNAIETSTEDVGLPGPDLTNQSRPLSSDGRYVFFSTRDALVPQDSNGRFDTYVYDTEAGTVRLLSAGDCNCNSRFVAASPDGHDVFFTTKQPLLRADGDSQADLYDARIGGGIAAQNAPPPAECQGDACQPVPSQPPDVTPASQSFSGAGSPPPNRKRKPRHHHKHHRQHHKGSRASHGKQGGSK